MLVTTGQFNLMYIVLLILFILVILTIIVRLKSKRFKSKEKRISDDPTKLVIEKSSENID